VNRLAAEHPRLHLLVLGAGVAHDAVIAAFAESVRARVRCVETKTDAETAREFAGADIFVLPSLFEGTPLTLMEAMMSGLPVVTTDTCGMRDVIRHGENGWLIPIRSPGAIVAGVGRLLASSDERARLGRAAQHDAQTRYTWDRVAAPIRETYERLSGERR
jgi:glycosyltransferase involved in cell wall biosynthesis